MRTDPIHPAVRVGHIHLRVASLDRAIEFYRDALGFHLTAEWTENNTAFLAAGDYHHHISLTDRPSASGSTPPPLHAEIYQVAFLYPDRRELGRAIRRLLDQGHEIDHVIDHGATVSAYLSDPDGNRIELYYDRPRAAWYDLNRRTIRKAKHVDLGDLLRCEHGQPRVAPAGAAPAVSSATREP